MSAPQFTPGPWQVTDRGDLFRIRNDNDEVVATTDNGGHPVEEIFDYATQEANARLIAAAPELYKALDGLLDAILRDVNKARRIREAERVLAKARGEQP